MTSKATSLTTTGPARDRQRRPARTPATGGATLPAASMDASGLGGEVFPVHIGTPSKAQSGTRSEGPWSRDLIKEIAMDIGKDVVAYIEVMYPKAIEATSSTFKLSVRNSIYNEIMAAIEVTDEGEIRARLRDRKKFRRDWTATYRRIRKAKVTDAKPATD